MPDKKYIWVKTHEPNLDRFAELVVTAKGDRSMRAFAQACDLNPATFTRITKKRNTGSSRTKLIEAIAANADPNSGVTLELLADASGYTRQEVYTVSEKISDKPLPPVSKVSTSDMMARTIVIQALARKNLDFKIRPNDSLSTGYHCIVPDLLIEITYQEGTHELLFIEYIPHYFTTPQTISDRFGRYTLTDAYKADNLPPVSFLMVVSDEELYNSATKLFSNGVPIASSIILVDFSESIIKKQHIFKRKKVDWSSTRPLTINLLYES